MRIMFPFVSSVDDFIEARDFVRECIGQLAQDWMPVFVGRITIPRTCMIYLCDKNDVFNFKNVSIKKVFVRLVPRRPILLPLLLHVL